MAGLGVGLAFLGYWTLYYGVSQVQGWNYGFLDLGIPSRWAKAKDLPRDPATTARATKTTTAIKPDLSVLPKGARKSPANFPRFSPGKG